MKRLDKDYYCKSEIGEFPNKHQCGRGRNHKGLHRCYDENCSVSW